MSNIRLKVESWNCSRAFLLTNVERFTVKICFWVGSGIGPLTTGARTLYGLHNLFSRFIDQIVVVRFKLYSDFLAHIVRTLILIVIQIVCKGLLHVFPASGILLDNLLGDVGGYLLEVRELHGGRRTTPKRAS